MNDENESLQREAMQLADAFGETAEEGSLLERFRTSAEPADVASAIVEWASQKLTIKTTISTFDDLKVVTCKTHGSLKFLATSVSTDVWLRREGEDLVVAIRPSQESGAGTATAATGFSVVMTGGIAPVLGVGYHAWVKSKLPHQLMEVVQSTTDRMPSRRDSPASPPPPTRSDASPPRRNVDPNLADINSLEAAGFAPRIAQTIVTTREQGGPFKSIPDLLSRTRLGPHEISRPSALIFLPSPSARPKPPKSKSGDQRNERRREIF